MPKLSDQYDTLYQYFCQLLNLNDDQGEIYRGLRKSLQEKAWKDLERNLERLESLALEQSRISKEILLLREQIQAGLEPQQRNEERLMQISELLPLIPHQQQGQIRDAWLKLRSNLVRRQSELKVLQHYSEEKQEMIQGFLKALQEDEQDQSQTYSRLGQPQSQNAGTSRIFIREA